MTIETKFSIGEKVWRVMPIQIHDGCPECGKRYPRSLKKGYGPEPVRIRDVVISIGPDGVKEVRYSTCAGHEGVHGFYPFQHLESDFFSTEVAAMKEAQRRSKIS